MNKREQLRQKKPLVYDKIIAGEGKKLPIIQLQYRYACNFKCKHCSIDLVKNTDRESIDVADIKMLADQAHNLGMYRFVITGGEPLLFNNLDQITHAIGRDRFYINIDTNGWYLDREKVRYLKSIGIDRVQLSIDNFYSEEHDDFRNAETSHARCIRATDYCLEEGMDLFIQTVVTKERLYSKEFIDFIRYFNNLGVSVFVSFAKPAGAWSGKKDMLIDTADLKYMEELEKKYTVFTHLTPAYGVNEERNCIGGSNIVSVTQYGDVLICPYFYCSFGNIKEEPLEDILKRMQSLKTFKKPTCLIAADKEFIDKYTPMLENEELPVHYTNIFTGDDFE